jgi:hypothetical protein
MAIVLMFVFVLTGCGELSEVSTSDGKKDEPAATEEKEKKQEKEKEERIGTRKNPVGHNETVEVKGEDWLDGEFHYELTLLETVSGDKAWEKVRAGNQFNDKAGDGKEYILAKFHFKLHSVDEEPFDLNPQRFDVISAGGSSYEDFVSVSGLDPEFRSDLYEGGDIEGWVPFVVDVDDEKPLAVFARSTDGGLWFDLRSE